MDSWRRRLLGFGLVLGGVLLLTAPGRAGILDASWTAPTTNVDGSPLTDLAGYQIYYGLSNPPCPGPVVLSVASATSSPGANETVTTRLTGLSAGALYYVSVTAVNTNGNESACATPASAVARTDFAVSPVGAVDFGSVSVGGFADRTFTLQNTGGGTISGIAVVSAPFSVVSGNPFNLVGAGATQAVTVRFSPSVVATAAANVNFTAGGDAVSRAVTGIGCASTDRRRPPSRSPCRPRTPPSPVPPPFPPPLATTWVSSGSSSSSTAPTWGRK